MCIIVFCDAGVESPDKSLLEMCELQNSDGAGIAVYNPDTELWDVTKGLMGWNEIEAEFDALNLTADHRWFMHFRFGTSGLKDGGNTHPFLVTDNMEDMRQEKFSAARIACHNGVVGSGEKDYSDTMVCIRDYVVPMMPYMHDENLWPIFGAALKDSSNRWLVTDGPGYYFWGSWIKEQGVWWSNDYFKCDRTYKTSSPDFYDEENGRYDIQGWKKKKKSFITTWSSNKNYSTYNYNQYDEANWYKYNKSRSNHTPGKTSESLSTKVAARLNVMTNGDIDEQDMVWLMEGLKKYEAIVTDQGDVVFQDNELENDYKQFDDALCPSCEKGGGKYIIESPFLGGDAYCTNCGCIYESGSGEINAYDPEFVKYHG